MATRIAPEVVPHPPGARTSSPGAAIGVLDSGLGGLSIVRALRQSLPDEPILYYADSAFCPYGEREEAFIRTRTVMLSQELQRRGAKALVIACNTACAAGIEDVRQNVSVPVIGLEPAVKPAAALTRSGRIAVFATPRTVASARLARLVEQYAREIDVELIAAPGWVELVEENDIDSARAETEVARLVCPAVSRGADVLVLGCTHYPFLSTLIARAAGPGVSIVDSGNAIARRTRSVLDASGLLSTQGSSGEVTLLTSAPDPQGVQFRAAAMLRGSDVQLFQ